MREPEIEEDDVVTPFRPPRGTVGENKGDAVVVTDAASRTSRGVQVPGPQASSSTSPVSAMAPQAASRTRDAGDIEKRFEVRRRSGTVVGDLVRQQACELVVDHRGIVAVANQSQ